LDIFTDDFELELGPSSDLDDGTYRATLTALEPFSADYEGETRDLLRWSFETMVDGDAVEVSGASSRATGPNSQLFRWLSALVGSEATGQPKARFKRSELIGREAMIVVEHNARGWPKVANVVPAPRG
jgi:hypothetical protein